MNFYYLTVLVVGLAACGEGFLFSSTSWDDLKVTWGINPFDSNIFFSLPRNEPEAIKKGWTREKNCSQVNGNRYILNGDGAVMLIFANSGIIAGIAAQVPKGLPFNFPSPAQQQYFNDEGDFYTISAYFMDPNQVCRSGRAKQITGDRLIVKSEQKELNIPLTADKVTSFFTMGQCFYTMGLHYWADLTGAALTETSKATDFLPLFLMYNKGI